MAQIQFRSDDTTRWRYGYGTGSAGNITINSNTTLTPATATITLSVSSKSATIGSASTFSNGDLVLVIQNQGTNYGEWHFNKIISGAGTTSLTLESASPHAYSSAGNNNAQIVEMVQYKNFTINSTFTLNIAGWAGSSGGVLPILCSGNFVNNGIVNLNNLGFRGGNTTTTEAYSGEGVDVEHNTDTNQDPTGTSGGGGLQVTQVAGGGGGHGTAGSNDEDNRSIGGSTGGNAGLTNMIFGGAGGGWIENSSSRGSGGNSGGILLVVARSISGTGSITVNGQNAPAPGWGGGGAGSGGAILFKGASINLSSMTVTASGGTGGNGTSLDGGAGGVGRIHADYAGTFTGTTTPTIDTRQDKTLYANTSSMLIAM